MGQLVDVPVMALPVERFAEVLDGAEYRAVLELRDRARRSLAGTTVWCVNSTANGGGVAEMLRSLLAFARGAGIDSRWTVLRGDADFFAITKRLHNRLHGARGDGGPLGRDERTHYEAVTRAGAQELLGRVRPGDTVILHDPQTAGMAPVLADAGMRVVWRLHVGADDDGARMEAARAFLLPYVRRAERYVVSRARFAWPELAPARGVCHRALDRRLLTEEPAARLGRCRGDPARCRPLRRSCRGATGLCARGRHTRPGAADRERGPSRAARTGGPVRGAGVPLGPVEGSRRRRGRLRERRRRMGRAHLLLTGPAPGAVADDPEAAAVFADVCTRRSALAPELRARIHLALLPVHDVDENAAIVNAIQRGAAVVVQKSLAEGFGLTVTEAMWKGRPLVVSRVGGIQDQVTDGEDGLTVEPRDLDGFGAAVARLLGDPVIAARLGADARARARERFLAPRHLAQWVEVVARREAPAGQPAA